MTAIYEALKAEREQRTFNNEQQLQREQKLMEFLHIAESFTDVCKLLSMGEQLIVTQADVEVSEDASTVTATHLFVDEQRNEHIVQSCFTVEEPIEFNLVLMAAADAVRSVAAHAGLLDLEAKLIL
ncbi:hypothetical protein SEA_GREKAYCON_56 [Arthrobacter phage Grekaycon]|uniref:Uncharacterized protein n=2 Tax=Marthavirus martha TaxID=1980950 RepID=A0A514A5K1_9CAUD|nr:hypothetical protein FDH49_gp56 [Arthrobacter phage Martha]ALY09709.1 hypothetical protein MARTHA_56 [Arthrobacter phage Martha]QDH48546.1 hypothetical protein SEA_GREKAYCON_56 [Arthrobacter phage Grekaycon]